jgi:hypothetical protein
VCGGGTSSAKSGFAQSLYVGPSMIAALLNNIPTIWAIPLAGYIGAITYELSTFCSTDPPPVPTITALDVASILNVYNPVLNVPAAEKFQQLVGAYLWYEVCQCDTVATPAPPTPPAAPTAMPDINPQISPPVAAWTHHYSGNLSAGSSFVLFNNTAVFPADPLKTLGADQVVLDIVLTVATGAPTNPLVEIDVARGNGVDGYVVHNVDKFGVAIPGSIRRIQPVDASVNRVTILFGPGGGSGSLHYEIDVSLTTNGSTPSSGGGLAVDPLLQAQIDNILGLVTLIQRQIVPFAYVEGAAHTGLTGDGSISVFGLIGAALELTDVPQNASAVDGDPDTVFGCGWINWGNTDGVTPREFIAATTQLSLPPLAGQFTQLHYSLPPGAELTITELEREP